MILETHRLRLSRSRDSDRDNLFMLEQDPEVMRYINGGNPTPLDGIDGDADYLMPRGNDMGIWVARSKTANEFIGWYSLRAHVDGVAELGYRLRRCVWGRGLALEGANALLALGFSRLGYARIFATTMAVNRASRRVMEKAGLTYVRTRYFDYPDPLPGNELGDMEYEITREAWLQRQSMTP